MLQKDPRNYQILFLCLFLVLGIGTRDWTLRPDLIIVLFLTCLLTQWIAISIVTSSTETEPNNLSYKLASLKSAIITALGLTILLRADHYSTMMLAGSLAILSKFLLQVEKKHFFNPANFGIIAALVLTPDAWVSPGQWGDDGWYAMLFLGTGGMVLNRVGRWDTTAAFLGSYALLEATRNLWLGWTWDVLNHRLMNGSLLLFAFFMITDPRSIPDHKYSRILWAVSIAVLTFILRNQFFLSTAVFWALFCLAPLSILFNYLWSAPRFDWFDNSKSEQLIVKS
ncbi:MAG: RnfABCDGE type electron transport complex subunit D [Coleofasciculaceae cyanobacterium]